MEPVRIDGDSSIYVKGHKITHDKQKNSICFHHHLKIPYGQEEAF